MWFTNNNYIYMNCERDRDGCRIHYFLGSLRGTVTLGYGGKREGRGRLTVKKM